MSRREGKADVSEETMADASEERKDVFKLQF
jgi:hypothetical protein